MTITHFGVRGSIPSPGPLTKKYGGNTSCTLIELDNSDFIILDAGTGIRELGNYIVKNYKPPYTIHLLLTHTHWDHIMGLPFFRPIYIPGTKIILLGPVSFQNKTLKQIVTGQLTYEYFPVNSAEVAAEFSDVPLKEEEFDLCGVHIQSIFLNHPILTLGYRMTYQGKSFATVYDHEVYRNLFTPDETISSEDFKEAEEMVVVSNKRITDFYRGVDLLMHDSQYTKDEYLTKYRGYGHSFYENVLGSALAGDVGKLIFFHHDPERTDGQLDFISGWVEKQISHRKGKMDFCIAREGMTHTL